MTPFNEAHLSKDVNVIMLYHRRSRALVSLVDIQPRINLSLLKWCGGMQIRGWGPTCSQHKETPPSFSWEQK